MQTADDLENYLKGIEDEIASKVTSMECFDLLRVVEYSQLLSAIGKTKESLNYAKMAWDRVQTVADDNLMVVIYNSSGALYASLLDYVNDVEKCGKVFEALNEHNPNGYHIGEYAYFLHRRKRDFDQAERYINIDL
jgi:hypothetical protein